MPDANPGDQQVWLTVSFRSAEDRDAFFRKAGLDPKAAQKFKATRNHWSMWWPPRPDDDLVSVQFEESAS